MVFESEYEFPRVIVWDALIDPDLVSGWLAEAKIVPEVGGEYTLRRLHLVGRPQSFGRISVLLPAERLDIETSNAGRVSFELFEIEGGSRGTSTRLRVKVENDVEPAFDARTKADWLMNLEQLEQLLRGHPVDWANWDRDHHAAWSHYLDTARHSSA
jgi:uncharacterized protein YndB with AHSA1/START domain